MTKLSDTQAILLSTAAQRDDGSLLPLPSTIANSGAGKAIAALIRRGFAEERKTSDLVATHRTDRDIRYGVFATGAGLTAIGIEPESPTTSTPLPAPAVRTGKTEAVLTLLRRAEGATLAELIAATSWLPHTTRAALTGLRKKGHAIERGKRGEETSYRVAA